VTACKHQRAHHVDARVGYMTDSGRFTLELNLRCDDCGHPFVFVGLPAGLNLDGAAVSVDGTEGRFAVLPEGQRPPSGGIVGFNIKVQ
jgi:hypothetical protein